MWFFFKIILIFLDFLNQKKIYKLIKKTLGDKLNVVIDVGSHRGETIKILNSNFEINKIYGFEPSKLNFEKLKFFLEKKKYKNTQIFNLGCGSESKTETLNYAAESSSSSIKEINEKSKYFKKKKFIILGFSKKDFFTKEQIEVKKIDDILLSEKGNLIDLIKIDTEGYELDVLKGATSILETTKTVYFEHHYDNMIKKNYTFRDINRFLRKNNFKKIYKFKMPLRKTFEYIYIKNNLNEKKN